MTIGWELEAQLVKQLYVNRQGRKPFLTPDHMGGSHQVIVHRMGKVISRNAGGLDDYDILEVFRNVQLTADSIHHLGSANVIAGSIRYAGGFQSDDEVIATLQPFSDFLLEHLIGLPISVAGPFAVDSRSDFQLFLFLPNLGNLLFGKKVSEMGEEIVIYPQALVNAKVNPEYKKEAMNDSDVQARIAEVEKKLEGVGRVLIRPSGTEPLIRVMLEGEDTEELKADAEYIAQLIIEKFGEK